MQAAAEDRALRAETGRDISPVTPDADPGTGASASDSSDRGSFLQALLARGMPPSSSAPLSDSSSNGRPKINLLPIVSVAVKHALLMSTAPAISNDSARFHKGSD